MSSPSMTPQRIAAVRATDAALGGSPQLRAREQRSRVASTLFLAVTSLSILFLAVLLYSVMEHGLGWVSWNLVTNMPSRFPERSGLQSALFGTLWVIALTAVIAFPVGVGAAVYLEEYAPQTWWTRILQTNIANLAGVPSVVYGLLGLGVFVEVMSLGRSIIAGVLTMALLILPIIIIASEEALRAVPLSLRQAAFALGATEWQVAKSHVLPAAMPGILTGTILALSRAIGETAPLLVVGASGALLFNPSGLGDSFTVLPIQIFRWTANAQQDFKDLAAAGILLLLFVLLVMNAVAIFFRQRFSRTRW